MSGAVDVMETDLQILCPKSEKSDIAMNESKIKLPILK